MNFFSKIFFFCFCISISVMAVAQEVDSSSVNNLNSQALMNDSSLKLKIQSIEIIGNRKTKKYIIQRELQFRQGDSISITDLSNELQKSRQQVYNTTLFDIVEVYTTSLSATDIKVTVEVKERWYIFPIPQFKLVDRNLNEWIVTHNADLSRVSYGIKFVHYNFTGRRDQLKIYLTSGYTRNVSFAYSLPYTNAALTNGFLFGGGYAQNKETNYNTSHDNKQMFYNPGTFTRTTKNINVGYTIRKAIKNRHVISLNVGAVEIADSIAHTYNPNYLKDSADSRTYVDLSYAFSHIYVDNVSYPLIGVTASAMILKRGIGFSKGLDALSVEGNFAKYFRYNRNWYSSAQFFAKVKLPFDQPFINQQALGYGNNYLRGLEYYVIDGVAFSYAKFNLKKKITSFSIPVPFKNKWVNKVPFTFYAKTYTDFGYSYNKEQYQAKLNNKFLYTGGFGVDIISLYDMSLRIEYSFNQLGENGLFLQTEIGFR